MKRSRSHLEGIKSLVDSSYTRFRNSLVLHLNQDFDKEKELGYCYKYTSKDMGNIYTIFCSTVGSSETDFRIMMHEYGHIYLAHLDGVWADLDLQVQQAIFDNRAALIEDINRACGIDFADELLTRIIDDPSLNHTLHNIAMDMEVNSKVLSSEDAKEVMVDIKEFFVGRESYLSKMKEKLEADGLSDEEKMTMAAELEKQVGMKTKEAAAKYILPEYYHLPDGSEFPNGLSYPEYLMMIIENMDQFIKMLISINNGGTGNTQDVSDDDMNDAMQSMGPGGSMGSIDDLMESCGMKAESAEERKQRLEKREANYGKCQDDGDAEDGDGKGKDHRSEGREEADQKREVGEYHTRAGGGYSKYGQPQIVRTVVKEVDEIDLAIRDVMKNYQNKVIKRVHKKDTLYLYNRGINRSVIAPTYRHKIQSEMDPTLVFLIDISGSMETELIDRVLKGITREMVAIKQRGLKYNIITWSTCLGEHMKDISPRKGVPRISSGGGTRMAGGIQYFRENYGKEATLILISDFDDDLGSWKKQCADMNGYDLYGFNYGCRTESSFPNFKVKNFKYNSRY